MTRSKTVAEKVRELYALMATAAAQRAIDHARNGTGGNAVRDAEFWAETTGQWLDRSSAEATRWVYYRPKLP